MTFSVPESHPGYCITFSSHISLGSPWLSKVDILGSGLSGASLKIWGAQCGVQSLCSSGRSWGFQFLLHSGLPHQGWGYSKIVSQPLLPATMWFLSSFARCVWVIHLVFCFTLFLIFSEEIASYIAVDSVWLWEEVNSVSSSCHCHKPGTWIWNSL